MHVFHRQGRRGGGVKRDKRKTFGFVGHPILSDVDADDRTKSIEQIGQFNVGNLEREVAHEYFGSTALFLFGQGNPRFCFGEVEKFHFLVVWNRLGDFGQWVGWGGVAIEVTGSVWVGLVVRCTRGQVLSMHWSVSLVLSVVVWVMLISGPSVFLVIAKLGADMSFVSSLQIRFFFPILLPNKSKRWPNEKRSAEDVCVVQRHHH